MIHKILGEKKLQEKLNSIILKDNNFIINLYGDEGAGKSLILNSVEGMAAYHQCKSIDLNMISSGELYDYDIGEYILLIDDIDHHMASDSFIDLYTNLLIKATIVRCIVTSKTRYLSDKISGTTIYNLEVGNRSFSNQEFCEYCSDVLEMKFFEKSILDNVYLFASYMKNYNFLEEILKKLKEKENISLIEFVNFIEKTGFYNRLSEELVIERNKNSMDRFCFNIRRKDAIEKLRDIILKYYPEQELLLNVLKSVYDNSSFIEELFRMDTDYPDKVMQLCFTYNPIELVGGLLGVRDIITELSIKKIRNNGAGSSISDKAKQLLKYIGLNITDLPRGVRYYKKNFMANLKAVNESSELNISREYLVGLGISCFQEMEAIFYELLNFYAIYFCGSLNYYIELYKNERIKFVSTDRLTYGDYIQLFSYLNTLAKKEKYQIALFELGRSEVVPRNTVQLMEELSGNRKYFSHRNAMSSSYLFLRKKLMLILNSAINLLEELIRLRVFPEIIKIKEIIFDEYGRKLFVGYDDDNNEIRFSMSNNIQYIDIYMHYYVLRKNSSFAINPIIIPKTVAENESLFSNGEEYNKSSNTQMKQADKLISMIEFEDPGEILDIGCGNGKTTIELYHQFPKAMIDAFDISDSMIQVARRNMEDAAIPEKQINFFVQNALDLKVENKYDLVFSNAALHWVVESQLAYKKIYSSLKPGGHIAIHQGGYDSYRGLHDMVWKAIEELDYDVYYKSWSYPVFYPRKHEMEKLLRVIGFEEINVESSETDGREFSNLIEDFANAGMLPYLAVLEEDAMKKKLKHKYFDLCAKNNVDLYSHRLYIFARKPVG